uniref:Uncharacterized protein n=1 Tax=viral metagenome TaxID=1070528 RepID=A0A6C0IB80_9ZZZZ
MNKVKTLIGKDNYLFLINDSNNSLYKHQVNNNFQGMANYSKFLDKLLFIVFPDKECICKDYLPDEYKINYRTELTYYKNELKNNILDPTLLLDHTDYFKTDTHMNLKGLYKVYIQTLEHLKVHFNVSIDSICIHILEKKLSSLCNLGLGLGDLTWPQNKQDLMIPSREDTYYYTNDLFPFYCRKLYNSTEITINILNYKLENITEDDKIIDWNTLSKDVVLSVNEKCTNNLNVIIFYDSFLIHIIPLLMKTFKRCHFCKCTINTHLINKINPDLILNFKVERFLN